MKELFMNEGNSIFTFKEGDIITRVMPSRMENEELNPNLGVMQLVSVMCDNSYLGDPMKYIGIFNNQIWLENMDPFHARSFGKKPTRLNLHSWSEGWAPFYMPTGYSINDL